MRRFIILTFLCFCVIYYNIVNTSESRCYSKELNSFIYLNDSLAADTSINDSILLKAPKSTSRIFKDISKMYVPGEMGLCVYVLNSNKNEYLKLTLHPGSVRNSIDEFAVGYKSKLPKETKFILSNYDAFTTNCGVRLGITKEELIKRKGKNFTLRKEGQLTVLNYYLTKQQKSQIRGDDRLYGAEYYLKKDTLIMFSFGYGTL